MFAHAILLTKIAFNVNFTSIAPFHEWIELQWKGNRNLKEAERQLSSHWITTHVTSSSSFHYTLNLERYIECCVKELEKFIHNNIITLSQSIQFPLFNFFLGLINGDMVVNNHVTKRESSYGYLVFRVSVLYTIKTTIIDFNEP